MKHLLDSQRVETNIVAPVPWFPFTSHVFGKYGEFARVPSVETRGGLEVAHPRYLLLPKIGMNQAPEAIFRAALPVVRKIIDSGFDFDLIDAHYFYPDGVAAVMLGKYFNKPVVITARGTDLNLITKYDKPKKKIIWAAENANALITVSAALKKVLLDMGIEDGKVAVLRNGVDLNLFKPSIDRGELRRRLGFNKTTLLSVGNLVELKGHHLIIEALTGLPDCELIIAGNGCELNNLKKLSAELGVGERVTFLGSVPHDQLSQYYSAADMLVLASSREGWANVLLESMACGTPAVATNVGGNAEVVSNVAAGIIVDKRSSASLASGIKALASRNINRMETRRFAENFSWEETTRGQLELFESVIVHA
ncbi:glycosyltransferase [Pseudomonadota bacterium]